MKNADSFPFSLAGQVALITGGASGIGFAIAAAMKRAGARVAITGRRENALANATESLGAGAVGFVHDISQFSEAVPLVEKVRSALGAPTILVNNAGVHLKKAALETTEEEFLHVLNVHVLGAHAMTRAVVPGMETPGGGSVLFIASMASLIGIPLIVAYAAAKSAHLGMVRTLATELGSLNVRVNALAPGWIHTPMMENAVASDPSRRDKILSRTPLQRFGEVDEIADVAVFLASPAARFITGAVLPVDGGVSIGF